MKALKLDAPRDYLLRRDACSYGYFLLAPNHWEPATRTLTRVLDVEGGPVRCDITQTLERKGAPLTVRLSRAVSRAEGMELRALLVRMLWLDEPHKVIAAFHALDPRWKRSGRGRLMRSPTLFEDVIKTVTSCNVTWPSTVNMNTRLCEVVGRGGAFPTAARLARVRPGNLRGRCRVGYRDMRIIELSRMFARGEINEAWMADPATPDADVREALIALPGIGPYAAHNIMQLLGRFGHIPLDTESIRHGRTVLGYRGSAKRVLKQVGKHYEPFGAHKFRSYWFELWAFYEGKRGKAWTWEREKVGSSFTASQF
jgi:3-methyladenine DNA glycosylase/8-oxoguanine DNA glycosylase